MDVDWTLPELKYKERNRNRKRYSRSDYKRFDHITSSHMRAGFGSIGKVTVDCRFAFTKSRWGVLGESKNPAGILYLDLDFHQPPDCKLESATVSVTLAEEDSEEGLIKHRSTWPVKFTGSYGPTQLRGRETLVQTRKLKNRTPHVQVMGHGAGGIGDDKEEIVTGTSRWNFYGHISSTGGSIWSNTLQWELHANKLERQPKHNNVIHTAFALEHNATRFYMIVEVSGKLAKFKDKLKEKLKFGDKNNDIVTKVEWSKDYSSNKRLDTAARDLHLEMELENMRKVPVEMPDALPAQFHPAMTSPQSTAGMCAHGSAGLHAVQRPHDRAYLKPPTHSASTIEAPRMSGYLQHLPEATLENLSLAANLTPPMPSILRPARSNQTEMDQLSDRSGSATLVNSQAEADELTTQCRDMVSSEGSENAASSAAASNLENEVQAQLKTMLLLQWLRKMSLLILGLMAGVVGAQVHIPAETRTSQVAEAKAETKGNKTAKPAKISITVPDEKSQSEPNIDADGGHLDDDDDDDATLISAGVAPASSRARVFKKGLQEIGEKR
ncbi:hypothetical protein QBC43DRAFT_305527 [Cladorrhinum sp. PSN259]|nr:hypothetical protein QBC43DRAFT_305527 [Cladorrhinum sp. PSN259]